MTARRIGSLLIYVAAAAGPRARAADDAPGAGWRYRAYAHDSAIEFATGGAEGAFVDPASPKDDALVVLVDHVPKAPAFDVRSRAAWRASVVGQDGLKQRVVEDSLERIRGKEVYVCHYQIERGASLPEDTLMRVTRRGNRLTILSYAQTGRTFRVHAARVAAFYRAVNESEIPN